ncbi:MAG: GGDEF domain-containing protein [Actinomycetota bacterium]
MALPKVADPRRDDRERELARLIDVDRATVGVNGVLCGLTMVVALGLWPFYGATFTLVCSLPFITWLAGAAGLRKLLGIRRWTVLNMIALETSILLAVMHTGGADSALLHMVGMLGAPLVFYFPRRTGAVVASPLVVAGVAALHLGAGHAIDEPLNPIVAFLVAVFIPVMVLHMMELEMTHRKRAVIDPLTGCLNRHAFGDRVAVIEAQMAVTGEPVGVVMFDIDHFKQVNDQHGHAAGDAVLTEIAYRIRKALRSYELLCRLGGEEFAILLPGAGAEDAVRIAERVRMLVESLSVAGIEITISCGVASAAGTDVQVDAVLEHADRALYEAKHHGRNRTCVHEPA